MSRRREPTERPDALVYRIEDGSWWAFCTLCPRELGRAHEERPTAVWAALEHLRYSHALLRVYVEQEEPEHRRMVAQALPLVVAHDRTLVGDRWTS